jgi:hypothetical protein
MNYYNKYLKYKDKYLQLKLKYQVQEAKGVDIYQGTCEIPLNFNFQQYSDKAALMSKEINKLKLEKKDEIDNINKQLKVIKILNKNINIFNQKIIKLNKRINNINQDGTILTDKQILLNILDKELVKYQEKVDLYTSELIQLEDIIKPLDTYKMIKEYNNILCIIKTYLTDYHDSKLITIDPIIKEI